MKAGISGPAHHVLPDPRDARREIAVFTYRPSSFTPDSPVVLVLHGRNRNGADYRDWWSAEAERRGLLVVAPEFTEAQYAHPDEYNFGAMFSPSGEPRPRSDWIYDLVEKLFADARRRFGSRRERFYLFGHSAGGQLVHRLATFAWSDAIEAAIAANAGCYTMPVPGEQAIGTGRMAIDDDVLRALFARPLTVMLGDADIDPNDRDLPRDPEAMRQGPHRFARGHHYFETARREAKRLGVALRWRLVVAPGVAHSAKDMAPHAARHFFGAQPGSVG